MNTEQNHRTTTAAEAAGLSERDFAALGMNEMAYIKPASGEEGFTIHAADGTPLGQTETHELALFALRHHGLEPVSVH